MVRGNGYAWQPTIAQLLRQPAGTLLFLGPDMWMTTGSTSQNRYNYAWIGRDNFIYISAIGSSTVTPVYDCNDYANKNANGTFKRVTDASKVRGCDGNCCDPTASNLAFKDQICNYPAPSDPTQTMNICQPYTQWDCRVIPFTLAAVTSDNAKTEFVATAKPDTQTIITQPKEGQGSDLQKWIFSNGKILLQSDPTRGISAPFLSQQNMNTTPLPVSFSAMSDPVPPSTWRIDTSDPNFVKFWTTNPYDNKEYLLSWGAQGQSNPANLVQLYVGPESMYRPSFRFAMDNVE